MGLTALMVVAVPSAASASNVNTFKNLATGLCMTDGGSLKNSTPITQYKCNGSENQLWKWPGAFGLVPATGAIINADNGKCMTDGGSTANSAPITQYTCHGGAAQTWTVNNSDTGGVTISNANDMCMTNGGSSANSAPITQYKCNGSGNQDWELET
jgi:hypothetical protein